MAGAWRWLGHVADRVVALERRVRCLRPESEVPHLRWSQAPPLTWQRPGSADMGVSMNKGTPKWMAYNGKSY